MYQDMKLCGSLWEGVKPFKSCCFENRNSKLYSKLWNVKRKVTLFTDLAVYCGAVTVMISLLM